MLWQYIHNPLEGHEFGETHIRTMLPAYAQCGGQGWTGGTTCVSGYYCSVSNPYYSQCLPGTATSTTTTSSGGSSTSTSTSSTASPTSTAGTGKQIRGVSAPVYHLYLQNLNGAAVLGPEASSGYFNISGSIQLTGSSPTYLNIGSETTSYRSLSFGTASTFSGWGLEGDTIITTQSSSYGRQLNFAVCPASTSGYYNLYLQLGSDLPSSSCTNYMTIHLPCLC
ncbi:hypothetical protein BKA62DRAFT_145344 [Auriculariales sp. MPI-PUGE-AT-0066]|nr:hypothetical protein BKA62DRAFT_145344 [Auriculariales sp. MPI-PUGE-AT-0066]